MPIGESEPQIHALAERGGYFSLDSLKLKLPLFLISAPIMRLLKRSYGVLRGSIA